MRNILILLLVVAAIVLIAVFGFGVGQNEKTASTNTTTVSTVSTTTSQAQKKLQQQRAGSNGAAVDAGPGSASAEVTGAPGAAGLDDTPQQLDLDRPFATDSPWNTAASGQPTDADSASMIRLAQQRVGLVATGDQAVPHTVRITDRRGVYIKTGLNSIPIYSTANGVETKLVCRQLPPYCGDGRNVPSLPIPNGIFPQPRYDGPLVVENPQTGIAYAMWRARRGTGNVMSYQFMRRWTLNGPGYQQPNSVSTIGSGLPSFAGLLMPKEVRQGRIEHALAIAIPGPAQTKYVQPASATDGVGSTASIPEGARIRLKANVKAPKLPGRTNKVAQKAIMKALRTYGAIVVERSASPSLYAKANADWAAPLRAANGRYLTPGGHLLSRDKNKRANATPLLRGNEIQGLHLSDFEVVQLPSTIFTFPALNSTEAANRPGGSTQTPGTSTTSGGTR
jgi:hypothetical protein